jgi:hypothetical protein
LWGISSFNTQVTKGAQRERLEFSFVAFGSFVVKALYRGNEKQIFAPVPADESAQIRPPWASTMARGTVHEFYTN